MENCTAHFVLVGGEAAEMQGGLAPTREFLHTSLSFVGEAYEQLRAAGVPRRNIIVIAQLADYLGMLEQGVRGGLTSQTYIPPRQYAEQKTNTEAKCARLLAEGGAHYDHRSVALLLSLYFPSMPLFRRLFLHPHAAPQLLLLLLPIFLLRLHRPTSTVVRC